VSLALGIRFMRQDEKSDTFGARKKKLREKLTGKKC
jgi:hypothetical protein